MTTKEANSNPLPVEHLIVFDGVCYLCSGRVRFLLKRDREAHFHFAAVQSKIGRRLLNANGLDPDNPESFIYLQSGRAFFKSEAVLRIVKGLPAPWCWLTMARIIPRFFRDLLYDLVARNRYSLSDRAKTCIIPTDFQPDRFLTDSPSRNINGAVIW